MSASREPQRNEAQDMIMSAFGSLSKGERNESRSGRNTTSRQRPA